ncbi:MAG: hypothetical protein KGS09_13220 [Nitrospirae bacterium]|nr:hypothetical protein [Nitrospirota bacterium]MBU6481492.1 hypothetical protein [Nitrospirota bacterium]MDE3221794.1 hypothetical protein [Nitrospirota bacterium]
MTQCLDPENNPTKTGGRQHRFASTPSVTTRNFRTDQASERRLRTLGEVLAGAAKEDRLSLSLLLRRAVEIYVDHVQALDRWSLDAEKGAVRKGSTRPTLRKKKPQAI